MQSQAKHRIQLDWSCLLGFDQLNRDSTVLAGSPSTPALGAKSGQKIAPYSILGAKVGGKVGLKVEPAAH